MGGERAEKVTVDAAEDRTRLDRFLAARLPDLSRARIRKLALEGRVLVGGKAARPSRLVRKGETIEVTLPAPVPTSLVPEPIPLEVLHEDGDLLVIVKPAGLVVHPGAGRRSGTLVNALLARGPLWSTIGGEERPGIVHRLDRGTSGVMVIARNDRSHRSLSAQFKARTVEKVYLAVVGGRPSRREFRVDDPLGRDRVRRTRISSRTRRPREASTLFEVREQWSGFALIEARPLTGRTHQIRAHLRAVNLPILGDREYGGRSFRELPEELLRAGAGTIDRVALHAWRLSFDHPSSGERCRFEAPLPAEMIFLIGLLRGSEGSRG